MNRQTENRLRKAAVLLTSLDQSWSTFLLGQMSAGQRQQICRMIEQLGEVTSVERNQVVHEFLAKRTGPAHRPAGVELDRSLVAKIREMSPESEIKSGEEPVVVPAEQSKVFQSLQQFNGKELADLLAREHPQTVAIVIANLAPRTAAAAMAGFPPRLQVEVTQRLADIDLESANLDVLRDLENELQTVLEGKLKSNERLTAGIESLQAILDAATPESRAQLLSNLSHHNRRLAQSLGYEFCEVSKDSTSLSHSSTGSEQQTPQVDELTPPSLTSNRMIDEKNISRPTGPVCTSQVLFANLNQLDDRSLQTLLEAIDPGVVRLALLAADRAFTQRVLQHLSVRDARLLSRELTHLVPTRLSDVDAAQQFISTKASQMATDDRIDLPLYPTQKHELAVTSAT
ncbi:MAG: hypothetical protein CMJ81_20600 [Planctomycetaceae bacterium]|nr:hypothetical protein [Planctomycetaceae bacterium]MBP63664.1 hypothetical protein [Planctomycetaceae bacterium]